MSAGSAQLAVCALSVISSACDIVGDNVELTALVVDHMRDIPEQLIKFAHGLFDVADFSLALNDQGFLEVDVGLIC